MSIANIVGDEFDVVEPSVTHHTLRKLRREREDTNTAIDNLRIEISDLQKKRDAIQALIDEAKLCGAIE